MNEFIFGWKIVSSETNYAVSALNVGNVEGGKVELFENTLNDFALIKN